MISCRSEPGQAAGSASDSGSLLVVDGVLHDLARDGGAVDPRLDQRAGLPEIGADLREAESPPEASTTLVSRSVVSSSARRSASRPGNSPLSSSTDQPRPHSYGETVGSYSIPPMMKPPSIRNRSSAAIPITFIPCGSSASTSSSHSSSARARSTQSSYPSSAV